MAGEGDWTEYGGEGGRHYTPLDRIDAGNVAGLRLEWTYHTRELEALAPAQRRMMSLQATPLALPAEAGGALVFCTPLSRVIALDPLTGAERWRFDPQVRTGTARPWNCRGVAYADTGAGGSCGHRVLLASYDRRLIALDARSGERCAGFGTGGEVDMRPPGEAHPRDETTHPSPPAVVDGVIVVGSGVMDFVRANAPGGTVRGYDLASGTLRWEFEPLPAQAVAGEWPAQARRVSGAANAWAPLAVDRERGLVFLPTGSPSPDYYGGARPGNNRPANSVVALRAATGEVIWSYQVVHHDLWDYDLPAQPILAEIEHEGRTRAVVIQLTKQGLVFVLDRDTGEPVWPVDERVVPQGGVSGEYPSATQPFPRYPVPLLPARLASAQAWGLTPWDRGRCRERIAELHHDGLYTPIDTRPTLMLPGSLGGANWGGGAVDPASGLLLVNISNTPASARLVPAGGEAGSVQLEGFAWRMVMGGSPWAMETAMLVSPLGIPCSPPPWGELAALDLRSATWRWRVPLGSVHDMGPLPLPFEIALGTPNLGGGLATGGGLFFIAATMDRTLRAFETASGRVLWRARLPADANATPVSYLAGGRQFVVVAAGGHFMFGQRPQADAILAFALPPSP